MRFPTVDLLMINTFSPGLSERTVLASDGRVMEVPPDWVLLPPGDPALTRRTKAAGDHWVVQEKKGRKVFSKGIWAPAETIEKIKASLEAERSTEAFAKKKAASAKRREVEQEAYVEDFTATVAEYLAFHPSYGQLAEKMAKAISLHATPVGSGTVARTKRIPIEQRAEAAVIAWMRHRTTAYDTMKIARVKGKRREVRRMLAQRSKDLLIHYRDGQATDENCPLFLALNELS